MNAQNIQKRAEEYYGSIGMDKVKTNVVCEAPSGDGAVYIAWPESVKSEHRVAVIHKGGKAYAPRDAGYGPALAFEACGLRDRLADRAQDAARVFLLTEAWKGNLGSLVTDVTLLDPAQDGAMPEPPRTVEDEHGKGLRLVFWTDHLIKTVYTRYEVAVPRDYKLKIKSQAHEYDDE